MATKQTVAVLGAGGLMGFAMARNLAREGYAIRAWNRSREKAEPLAQDGAEVADTPAEAAEGAEVILTMLADADTVLDAMDRDDGALAASHAGDAIWLQMSTIGIEGTDRCLALAADRGLGFLDAPVLGTKAPAEQGNLVVLASGPEALRDRVQGLFDVVGARTMWVGEAGAATRPSTRGCSRCWKAPPRCSRSPRDSAWIPSSCSTPSRTGRWTSATCR
jgi:3-hydroxyisobutyrate dehydrogenase